MGKTTQSLDSIFADVESELENNQKSAIASEDLLYKTDPVYRARIDAERAAKAEEHERQMAACSESEEDDDEDGEDDE